MIEQVDKYNYNPTLRNMVVYPALVLAKRGGKDVHTQILKAKGANLWHCT